MVADKRYLHLIVKFLSKKSTPAEEKELEEWMNKSSENLQLFEDLINEHKWRWARQYLISAGMDVGSVRWVKRDGWYRQDRDTLSNFYVLSAIGIVLMILIVLFIQII